MFESIPQAVPDSYLLTKAAYRSRGSVVSGVELS